VTFLIVVTWKRLEQGIGFEIGPTLIPSVLPHQRRRVLVGVSCTLLLVLAAVTVFVGGPVRASRDADPTDMTADAGLLRYVPPDVTPEQPLTVLLVLHDQDSTGPVTAGPLLEAARRNHWAVIAPTLAYGDWSDPEQVVDEMLVQLPLLRDLVQGGASWGQRAVDQRVLVLGEGRGAHTAVAFALFYPESTAAIATVGPAPCVVPSTEQLATPDAPPLPFPYGVDDLEQYVGDELETEDLREVAVWMGLVPDDDVAANTCPWGALAGRSPSDRANVFLTLLRRAGARVAGGEYAEPGLSGRARDDAIEFLARLGTAGSP
jgi:pimeloyl-ACP methyl ester carboxylesterase